MSSSIESKTILVTGASAGIGKAAALELARRGASLILVSRDPGRGEKARAVIAALSGNPRVEFLPCDFSDRACIGHTADAVLGAHPKLDVLVNNAGIVTYRRTMTPEGLETQFAVNHLGYFYLTNLLLTALRAAAPSRIVVVSSGLHRQARLDFDDLQTLRGYKPMRVYGRTKLMNVLFTAELARRLAGAGVTVNALGPGFTATELGREAPAFSRWAMRAFGHPAEKGAETAVYLAVSPEVEGMTGGYFEKCRPAKASPLAEDREAARRLWDISARICGLGA
jgi:NAD(P)-dependent dehydrogenase (short-subunit alcohol dehydrogenase family)